MSGLTEAAATTFRRWICVTYFFFFLEQQQQSKSVAWSRAEIWYHKLSAYKTFFIHHSKRQRGFSKLCFSIDDARKSRKKTLRPAKKEGICQFLEKILNSNESSSRRGREDKVRRVFSPSWFSCDNNFALYRPACARDRQSSFCSVRCDEQSSMGKKWK